MTIYTKTDLTIATIRSFLLPSFILFKFGLFTFLIYLVVIFSYYKVLKYVFGMECLAMLDEFFLLDS